MGLVSSPTASDVLELMAAGEGERLAYMRERARADELAETLAAFANRSGGTVLLGLVGRVHPKV